MSITDYQTKAYSLTLGQLRKVKSLLDAEYGIGFSKKNPEVVAQFVVALSTNSLTISLEEELKAIRDMLNSHKEEKSFY